MSLTTLQQEMLARARARIATNTALQPFITTALEGLPYTRSLAAETLSKIIEQPAHYAGIQDSANSIVTYNAEQQEAITACCKFEHIAICGSAGTGKTTIMKEVASRMTRDARMPLLKYSTASDKDIILRSGTPGIIAVSFTNTAVNNISLALDGIIPCYTIHKLLQFVPVAYEVMNEAGELKTTRRFEPKHCESNPLPRELRTIIIEESGVVSITLFQQFLAAIPDVNAVQFIFLGDLFQLDPPYDPAILGFVLTADKLKKVELTQVYRQKLNSPILRFALDIKDKKMIPSNHIAAANVSNEHGTLVIKPWKHRLDEFKATIQAARFLLKEWEAGSYFPEKDIVILPFNKRFGSTEMNILIADWFGKARKAVVHEVIAGFEKKYLAVGDHVMVSKRKGIITNIARNDSYLGKCSPQLASPKLDRFGFNGDRALEEAKFLEGAEDTHDEIDRLMAASLSENEDRMKAASHCVTVTLEGSGIELSLESGGDFNLSKFDFAYCMTCYKAQGSEWDTVYVFTHKSHAVSLCNEFFYTAATRAKKKLVMIVEPDHLSRAMVKQSIPGNNWQEKSKYFARNIKKLGAVPLVAKFILGE